MPSAGVFKGFFDLTIVASNVAELRRFYAGWGFPLILERGEELVVFRVGKNELALHVSASRPQGAVVISVLVESLAPVQARAAELGVALEPPTAMRPGLVGVAVCDPNGNKLEFLCSAP